MPSFADSFWTDDLFTGVNTLFRKLYEGCEQNVLFIQLFASRMQYEVSYGRQLCKIRQNIDGYDEKAPELSINCALGGMVRTMEREGSEHLSIAADIEVTVLKPFSKWCEEHKQRIEYSEKTLKTNITNYQKSKKFVEKFERSYFNKCRNLEDFKRTNFNEEELKMALEAMKLQKVYEATIEKEQEFKKFGSLGGIDFDYRTIREIIRQLLTKLEKSDYKVPLINYKIFNTNNGSEIVKFLMENLSLKDVDQAEAFGQDLLDFGFLKYCNGVGTTFVNSKKFQYSWKSYAYKFARIPEPNAGEVHDGDKDATVTDLADYFQDLTSRISQPSQAVYSNTENAPKLSEVERTFSKLTNEVEVADQKYRKECLKMDSLRCSIEELMVDHFVFMEKCESDRLQALKKVVMDFCLIMSNEISLLKDSLQGFSESEAQMGPHEDLLKMVENSRTGFFQPVVTPYNNYYNPGGYQNFGIDLETRCRLDKKAVPLIMSTILSYMDQIYPEMPNDVARTTAWTVPVKLHSTHQLRKLLNAKPFENEIEVMEILKESNAEPSTIASVLKIYLLELPAPLISNEIYDVLKALYAQYPPSPAKTEEQEQIDVQRVNGIANTLQTLSKCQIATLDAISTHFSRLIKILRMSSSDSGPALAEEFVQSISQEFANCIVQVKLPDGNEIGYKIFSDLLEFKKPLFRDIRRQNSKSKQ